MSDELKKLREYAEEIGVPSLSLNELIYSHQRLRRNALRDGQEMRIELSKIREAAKKQARDEVMHGEYVKVSALAKMSVLEIADLVVNSTRRTT